MMRETLLLFCVVYFVATTSATKVTQCSKNAASRSYVDDGTVKISGCDGPPCILKRKSTIEIEQHFIPQKTVQSLTTSVYANILGVPLPFVGVNGSDACDLIYNPDGTKASCPLVEGKEYVYKNNFPVLQVYPRINLIVHWALTENNNEITCFEIPSKITG